MKYINTLCGQNAELIAVKGTWLNITLAHLCFCTHDVYQHKCQFYLYTRIGL
jgi:hypothetical protein